MHTHNMLKRDNSACTHTSVRAHTKQPAHNSLHTKVQPTWVGRRRCCRERLLSRGPCHHQARSQHMHVTLPTKPTQVGLHAQPVAADTKGSACCTPLPWTPATAVQERVQTSTGSRCTAAGQAPPSRCASTVKLTHVCRTLEAAPNLKPTYIHEPALCCTVPHAVDPVRT